MDDILYAFVDGGVRDGFGLTTFVEIGGRGDPLWWMKEEKGNRLFETAMFGCS